MKEIAIHQLIENVKKILVISHMSPDCDAIASSLFVYNIIKKNYPDKELSISIKAKPESLPERFSFLPNLNEIQLKSVNEMIEEKKPELIIFTDGGDIKMFMKDEEIEVYKKLVDNNKIITACIDHHDTHYSEMFDHNYVEERLSGVEVVYNVMHKKEGLNLFEGWEEMLLIGLLSDSERFYFESKYYGDALKLVAQIAESGYSVRKVDDIINTYEKVEIEYMSELFANITFDDDLLYTYIRSEVLKGYEDRGFTSYQQRSLYRKVIDNYLNHVAAYDFCFIFFPPSENADFYKISVRSKENSVDCTKLLKLFEGGGYVTGGGGKIIAGSLEEAIKIAKERVHDFFKLQ